MCESLNSYSSLDRPSFSNFKHSKPSEQYTYIWTYSVCACTHMHLLTYIFAHTSVQFSHSVVSDSLQPHGPQHARPPCPSPTPRVYRNSSPVSWWCHPTIPSCCPLLLLHSIFPRIRGFSNESHLQVSHIFASGGQRIGVSASTSVLSINIQDWFLWGWTGWISFQSKGLSRVFSNRVQKHQLFGAQLSL